MLQWTAKIIDAELGDPQSLPRCAAGGQTALTRAVQWQWTDRIRAILECGVDPKQRDKVAGAVPAMLTATRTAYPEAIEPLLAAGTDPHRDLGWRTSELG